MISQDGGPPPVPDHARPRFSSPRAGWIVLLLSSLAIAFATLLPVGPPLRPLPTICIFCGAYGGIDFTLNTLLFIPYGVGLYLVLRRPWRAVVIAICTTIVIESLQLHVISGRDTSLGDLVANTLGAMIGVFLTLHWRTWILPTPRLARYLSWTTLVIWAGLLTLSGWALQPSPSPFKWFGQATPDLAQFGRFQGTLLAASVDGAPLVQGELPSESPTHTAFREGRTTINALVTPGWRLYPGTIAPIVSIFDRRGREVFIFGQKGLSLIFQSRTRTSELLLREPTVSLPDVFPSSYPRRPQGRPTDGSRIGDTVQLSALREPQGITLRAVSPVATQTRMYPFHIFLLWNAILPFDLALGQGIDILSAVWAAGLMVLPAYWFGWGRGSKPWLIGIIFWGSAVAALHVIPMSFRLHSTPWWAWSASVLGALLGWWLSAFARKRNDEATRGHLFANDNSLA